MICINYNGGNQNSEMFFSLLKSTTEKPANSKEKTHWEMFWNKELMSESPICSQNWRFLVTMLQKFQN